MELFRAQGFTDTTMRQVAHKAGVATGAAYYYFRSKTEIVLRFYRELQTEDQGLVASAGFRSSKGLEDRVRMLLSHKLDQLQAHRHFLDGVFRNAADPDSPLSPFSEQTRDIRESNIANLQVAIDGSSTNIDKRLKPRLARLLWFYQMGIILFWFYDRSARQSRSRELMDKSLRFVILSIRFFSLPLLGPLRKAALDLLESFTTLFEIPTEAKP
jgi:AcrR family transcriptional regulator